MSKKIMRKDIMTNGKLDLNKVHRILRCGMIMENIPLRAAYYINVPERLLMDMASEIRESEIRNESDWEFVAGYKDLVKGKNKYYTDFRRMMNDAKAGMFDIILTDEISHFPRTMANGIQNAEELLHLGVGVYFIEDRLCTLEPDADFILTILRSMAEYDSKKRRERAKRGLELKRLREANL